VVLYEQARRHFPDSYLDLLKLRMPPYLKIVLGNEFPRSHITTHLTRTGGLYFGPFRSRASAEKFESQFLDLFQLRRCQEDLAPSPAHPGCMYGEMACACGRASWWWAPRSMPTKSRAWWSFCAPMAARWRMPSRIPATGSATRCSSRRRRASTSVWKRWRT